ncbi:hypothetical protein NQ318_015802 [Aromia moschata]|uniref:Ig-like domain-containing protein n=1 Tax=Aromia moschata TaxID=1265417 RepID=A0AAV8YMT6_9CUCU|nr:hypothetical protein NQ318_015802 [Aromia moschata]
MSVVRVAWQTLEIFVQLLLSFQGRTGSTKNDAVGWAEKGSSILRRLSESTRPQIKTCSQLLCAANFEGHPLKIWEMEYQTALNRPFKVGPVNFKSLQGCDPFDGEVLTLMNVQRTDMGAYLCIASNVHPLTRVSNQLVAAPITSDVHVQCYVEASPKAMNHWMRDNGKHFSQESGLAGAALMNLTILDLDKRDFGGYICTSSNALGKAEGVVRLQGFYNLLK